MTFGLVNMAIDNMWIKALKMLDQDVDIERYLNNIENTLRMSSILIDIKLAKYVFWIIKL